MSAQNGPPYPPAYPPQPPPYGPPRSGGSGTTILAAVLAAVFVVSTAIAAFIAHDSDTGQLASSGISSAAVAPAGSGGGEAPEGGASIDVPSVAPPTIPSPAPLPSTSAVPSPPPLDPEAVNRVFQVYMNALLYHDLQGLKSATCPKLRHTETGTALYHHYINRWKGKPYTIYPGLDYVRLTAVVTQADNGVKQTYQWQVDRYRDGHYWVCGFYG